MHLDFVQPGPDEAVVHEHLFHRVAGRRVVCFGVHHDAAGLVNVGVPAVTGRGDAHTCSASQAADVKHMKLA